MKKLCLVIALVAFCYYASVGQTEPRGFITYGYHPQKKDTNLIVKCFDIEKVFCKVTKSSTTSLRLLENKRYEQLCYSKNYKTIVMSGGFYKISKKNVLYLNGCKVPKWTNYKNCSKYYLSADGLYRFSSDGSIAKKPEMLETFDNNYYKEKNYNAIKGEYWFGNLTRNTPTFSTSSCSTGYLSVNKFFHQKFIDATNNLFPEYTAIVTNSYAAPERYVKIANNKVVKWKNDTTDKNVQKLLITVLHESIHQKNFELNTDSMYGYYISENQTIQVPYNNSLYISEEIFESVDTNELYSIPYFAFDLLITYLLEENSSANIRGIYGLLDEFTAYAHDSKVTLQLCQLTLDSSKTELKNRCIADAYFIPDFYYTFNIMIGWYLEHAIKLRPELVSVLNNDLKLREAYTKINQLFEQQIEIFNQEVADGTLPATYDYTRPGNFESVLKTYYRLKPLLDKFKI